MRLWSLHPQYLDTKGLTALWREGLLARKVLLGATRGYRHHPQLIRFRAAVDPIAAIDAYLSAVLVEAKERGYNYDATKINQSANSEKINVTCGQMEYEFEHLKKKLAVRDKLAYDRIISVKEALPNPLFTIVDGEVEGWEVLVR